MQLITGEAAIRLILFDLPLLRDVDDVAGAGSHLYYLMAGYGGPGWPKAALYRSSDSAAWSRVGRALGEAAWVAAVDALGGSVAVGMVPSHAKSGRAGLLHPAGAGWKMPPSPSADQVQPRSLSFLRLRIFFLATSLKERPRCFRRRSQPTCRWPQARQT